MSESEGFSEMEYEEASRLVLHHCFGSISLVQRQLLLG
jgi:hypothetical protein